MTKKSYLISLREEPAWEAYAFGLEGSTILKWILKSGVGSGMDSSGSR